MQELVLGLEASQTSSPYYVSKEVICVVPSIRTDARCLEDKHQVQLEVYV